MSDLQLDIDFLINNPAIRDAVRKARLDIAGLADGAQKDVDRLDKGFSMLSKTLAGVFSIHAAKEFVSELISVRGQFQQIENSLTTILKSQDAANALMNEWKDLTLRSPYTLSEIAQSGKQLLAYGVDAKNVTKNIEQLANVAAGVSQPLGDIAYLYGTLKTQGRAYQMDINQFTNRGIPIVTELAKVMKVADSEVRSLVEAGKVGFPEVERAIANMTSAGGQFYNLIGKQAETLPGQINRLKHEWELMLNEIGTHSESMLAGGVSALANLVEHYEKVIDLIKILIITYGAYRAAVILNTVATSGATAAEALHYGLLVLKDKILTVLTAKTAGLTAATAAYTAVLAALAVVAYAGIQYQTAAEIAEDSLTEARAKGERAAAKEQSRIERLTKVIKDHTATKEAQIDAYEDLQASTDGILNKYTLEEISAGKADKALEAYLQTVKKAVSAETEYAQYNLLEEKLKEIEEKGIKAIGTMDRLWVSIKRTFAPTSQGMTTGQWWNELFSSSSADKGIVDAELKKVKDAQGKILKGANGKGVQKLIDGKGKIIAPEEDAEIKRAKKYANDLKDVIGNFDKLIAGAKSKADIEKVKEAVSEKINALAPGDAKIKEYQAKLKKVNEIEAQYSLTAGNKANKQAESLANKRLAFLNKLADKEAEIKRKGVEENLSEVQKTQKQYETLRKQADKLKLGAGVKERIDKAEKEDVGYLKYEQRTEVLEKELEKQKQLYANFEDFKKTVGEENAKKRFKNQIDTEKTYLQYVENLNKEFEGKTSLSGVEEKRQQLFVQQIQEAKNAAEQLTDQQYAEAFAAAKTHAQRLLDIEIEYQNAVKALGDSATDEQIANLQRTRNEKIQAEGSANFESVTNYRETLSTLDTLSRAGAVSKLKHILQVLQAERKANKISVVDYQQKVDEINDAIARINGTDGSSGNPFKNAIDAVKNWRDTLKEVPADSLKAENAFKKAAGAIGEAANGASEIVGSIAQGLDSLGIGSEQLQKDLANVQGMLGGIGDLAKGISTGNPVDIVKGSINLLTNAFELFNFKDKKAEKRIKAYQQQLKDLGKAFNDLERGINNSIGESYYADSESAIKNLRQQQQLLQNSIDEERGKKKSDAGKIDAWQAELDAIPGKIQDINNAVTEMLVQTSFKELANNLSDAFVEAFKVGEDAAGRFDDVFNQVIQNAVKNSLKLKFIEKPVSEFTEALATYMKGNGNSVAGFDFAKWKAILKSAGDSMTGALQGFEDFFKTDVDSKTDDKTVSAAIKGITSDQADLLAGQFGGQRIATLEGNELQRQNNETAMQQLAQAKQNGLMLVKIEDNTRRSAEVEEDFLPYLKEIASKMNDNNNALRAAGR